MDTKSIDHGYEREWLPVKEYYDSFFLNLINLIRKNKSQ